MSFSWPLGRPCKRERKRGIDEEVGGSVWKLGFWKRLEFWKMEKLVVVEEGRKENRKRKRKWKREIILLEEK